jgi:hypothetical protein
MVVMKNVVRRILLGLLCAGIFTSSFSCAALTSSLPVIIAIAENASSILTIIEQAMNTYLQQHPSATLQSDFTTADNKARLALASVTALASAGNDIDQSQVTAAFQQFEQAYNDLVSLAGVAGVTTSTSSATTAVVKTPEGKTIVPQPAVFSYLTKKK